MADLFSRRESWDNGSSERPPARASLRRLICRPHWRRVKSVMPRATPTLSTAVDLSCHSPRNSGDTGPPPPLDELSTFNAEADAHNASAPKCMTVARPDVEVSYTVTLAASNLS